MHMSNLQLSLLHTGRDRVSMCSVALMSVLSVALVTPMAISGEVNKTAILKELESGHAKLREQLSKCEIHGEVRYGGEREPIAFEMACYGRGERMRTDLKSTRHWRQKQANAPETKTIVASPLRSFHVVRMSESSPFVLVKVENELAAYQDDARQLGVIGWAPYSIFGLNVGEFLSSSGVTITSDSRPDSTKPSLRRIEFRGNPDPRYSNARGFFLFDTARNWRIVNYEIDNQTTRTAFDVHYRIEGGELPRLSRVQLSSGPSGSPLVLAQDYRVTSLSFVPPDESHFTLAHFGISLEEGSYFAWYAWLLGGGVLFIVLGFLGRHLYRRYEAA